MHPVLHKVLRRFRHHALTAWDSRGGGFYGFVAAITFLGLEGMNLVGDIASLRDFRPTVEYLVNWFVQDIIQGVTATVKAAIWPVEWMQRFGVGPQLAGLVVAAYLTYRLIHPTVRRLLEVKDEDAEPVMEQPAPPAS